jgi:SAM-dependent methyltransferase
LISKHEFFRVSEIWLITFQVVNVMQLPFPEATFDAVFGSNILLQFQDPRPVLTEVCRVVKPGGVVGFRELTFDGNLYEPPAGARHQYYALLTRMAQHNGGDPCMGRRLGTWFCRAGLRRVTMAASYVSAGTPEEKQAAYDEQARLCEESAWMEQAIALGWISRDGRDRLSTALRAEGADPEAFSAVASCEVVGWKAGPTPES